MKTVGVDFDNTIVCYDEVFVTAARQRQLVPPDFAGTRVRIREHLRALGKEDAWTELQGYVYGRCIVNADPFDGVLDFFRAVRSAGWRVRIVSHKTSRPYLGPPYDLRAAALDWLETRGFFDERQIGLTPRNVHLEETKADKLARIRDTSCDTFIDDLPAFLNDPGFPQGVQRILFDPGGQWPATEGLTRHFSWSSIRRELLKPHGAERG